MRLLEDKTIQLSSTISNTCFGPITFKISFLATSYGAFSGVISERGHFTPSGKDGRAVDIEPESYKIVRDYMARLDPDDFTNLEKLTRYANILNISPDRFYSSYQTGKCS